MALNESGNNWRRRQRDSMEFWMSVEAGRQAALAYRTLKSNGNRRADELAKTIIEKIPTLASEKNAVKEFDFRKSEYSPNLHDSSIDIDIIY